EPARGRKPVLRDELAAVVVKQQYPPERLLKKWWRAEKDTWERGRLTRISRRFLHNAAKMATFPGRYATAL
ncbi:MAG: hypothetical protein JXA30_02910, partial [Deltaproteobacteria bacterium]|nr:hypothetical protein [Deltaproteobacteria bacterium]